MATSWGSTENMRLLIMFGIVFVAAVMATEDFNRDVSLREINPDTISSGTSSTEASSTPSTVAPRLLSTEARRTPSTEAPSTPSTEARSTPSAVAPSTTSTKAPSTPSAEAPSTPSTEASSTPSTVAPHLLSTVAPSTAYTEASSTASTEAPSTASTEAPSTPSTEAPSTPSTVAPTTPSTEAPSTTSTEAPSTPSTEAPHLLSTVAPKVEANRTLAAIKETIKVAIINDAMSAMQDTLVAIIKGTLGKVISYTKFKIQVKMLKVTSRVLTKIAKKTGAKLLARLGLKAGKKAAVKIVTAITAKLGTTVETSASTGPGFPFVLAAQLAYDVLSLALDLGDTGGYNKMGTVKEYKEMKAGVDKELQKEITKEGGDFPSVVGPLDRLNDTEYEAFVNATINEMMTLNNSNPVNKNFISKLADDISDSTLTAETVVDDAKIETYAELVDSDAVFDMVCTKLNGKVVTAHGSRQCSYRDKQSCDSSYSWPLAEDSDEIYGEYKSNMYGGACVTESYAMRSICEGNHLPYDSVTGICKIDETYCKMKGAEYAYSDDVQGYDCVIDTAQVAAEFIFGSTIVRGLKQIFDPDQYEKCKAGETDDGYFCRSIFCGEGEEQWANGGICYSKCDKGYHPFGCCICSPDCPEGWRDDGATCRLAGHCDEGKDHDLALCYDKCKRGYYGVGPTCWKPCPEGYTDIGALCSKGGAVHAKASRPADKQPCPEGLTDDGTSCWNHTYGRGVGRIPDKKPCPSGMRDDGTSCWLDTYGRGVGRLPDKGPCPTWLRDDGTSCWSDAYIYGKGCCCTWWGCCNGCPSGYHDDGCTCRKTDVGIKLTLFDRQSCRSDEEKCIALCYPKCKSGYHHAGCNLCEPNGGPGIKVLAWERYLCNDDEEVYGALCYPKCKAGYNPKGCCLCEPEDGAGIKTILFDRHTCNDDETLFVGFCYSKCRDDQTDDGALCRDPLSTLAKDSYWRGAGTPDTVIKGKGLPYGRGVGTPAVHIRAKMRAVPFSSKDNK